MTHTQSLAWELPHAGGVAIKKKKKKKLNKEFENPPKTSVLVGRARIKMEAYWKFPSWLSG